MVCHICLSNETLLHFCLSNEIVGYLCRANEIANVILSINWNTCQKWTIRTSETVLKKRLSCEIPLLSIKWKHQNSIKWKLPIFTHIRMYSNGVIDLISQSTSYPCKARDKGTHIFARGRIVYRGISLDRRFLKTVSLDRIVHFWQVFQLIDRKAIVISFVLHK